MRRHEQSGHSPRGGTPPRRDAEGGLRGTVASLRAQRDERAEEGRITILVLGLFMLTTLLILGAIDVTAAQLARMRLLDTSDSLALNAANSTPEGSVYEGGLGEDLPLTSGSVTASAGSDLAERSLPSGISAWHLGSGTGTTDGQTATVELTGEATLPMTGWLLEKLGGSVTITVTSKARAPLR